MLTQLKNNILFRPYCVTHSCDQYCVQYLQGQKALRDY
jgi:hypothetical protein